MKHTTWLAWRRKGIGGSDAGAICGLNRFSSPMAVYLDKLELAEEKEVSEPMRFGNDMEEYVANRFMEQTGKKVRRNNYLMQHPNHEFMLANIDREVIGEDAILECKTMSDRFTIDPEKPEESYYVQCQHYMAVTGKSLCYLAIYQRSTGLTIIEIPRHEEDIESLIEIEREFWHEYVLKNSPPPADGYEATRIAIKQMFPRAEKKTCVLVGREKQLEELAKIKEQIKELEQAQAKLEQSIQLEMGEAERGEANGFLVLWSNRKGSVTLDRKRLQTEQPDIFERYKKQNKPSRQFKIREIEKEKVFV